MIKRLLPVYFIVFLGYLGYSLFLTIFAPVFLKSDLIDAPESTRVLLLGILIFLYPFGQFISSPILGALSDRFGRRPILLFSLWVTAIAYSVIGIALILDLLWLLYLSLFIAGLSEGNITIAQSAIADVADKGSIHKLFGYIYFSASCSYLIGPMLGGWLASARLWNGLSYELPFFIVSAMLFIALIWTGKVFKETLANRSQVSYLEGFTNIKNLFTMKHLRFWFLVNFLLYLASFGFLQGYPIYLVAQFGIGVGKLSLMIAWSDIPFLIMNLLFVGYIGRRYKSTNVLLLVAGFLGLCMILLLLPKKVDYLWFILLAASTCVAVALPISSSLVSLLAREDEQGRVMGINQSLNFFTEAVAGLGVGLLASAFLKLSMLFFAVMGFIVVVLLVIRRLYQFS